MTTPPAPSVINPDVPPPPRPIASAPPGDRSLSPDNSVGAPNKRSRIVATDDMEVETTTTTTTTTTSGPVSGLVSIIPSGLPVNKVTIITQSQTANASLDSSIHAHPLPASTVSSTNDKGKSVAFDVPVRQPSPNSNAAAIKSSSSRFHAAAYLHDAPVAFKEKFTTNRTMCDEVDRALSRYSSYGSRARCEGSGNNKRILVSFFVQEDHSACVQSHTQVRQAFSRYSNVVKCKLTTRNHYYNAHIQFADASSVTQFEDIWAIICLENSLRVCPASYLKSQRDSRREHVAILAGIPKNIKEADLTDIASQVNAKAINIPLSYNSYKPKPYAYFNFASFENLEAAKELTITFRGKGLSWHSPNEARELCHNDRSSSGSRSRSRSDSRSRGRNSSDRVNNTTQSGPSSSAARGSVNSSRRQPTRPHNKDKVKDVNQQDSSSNSGSTPPSSSQKTSSIPPEIIKEIREQILAISQQLRSLDERVEALEYSITDHTYRIGELEAMMNYDDSSPHNAESSYQPESYTHQGCGWDNEPYHNENNNSFSPIQQGSNPSIMDESPDASFSALDPKSVLARRHAHLPVRMDLGNSPNDAQLRQEILSFCSRHWHHIILGGDLNANFDKFVNHISNEEIRSPSHTLFRFLFTHQFDDLCALDSSTSLPLPTFVSASSGQLSRLDYLWTSPDFLATHLWSRVADTLDNFNSDHMLLISFFDFLTIKDMRTPSYLKQQARYRTVYNFHAALPDQKTLFTTEVDVGLKSTHTLDMNENLNRLWHRFKTALLNAARSAFPKQVISLNKTKKTPVELEPYQHISHKLDHYIRSLYNIFTISELYGSWNRFYFSFCPLFLELFSDRSDLINQLPVPDSLYSSFVLSNLSLKTYLNKVKALLQPVQRPISAKLKLGFNNYKQDTIS
ncbi:hypothetical protein RhiirA4_429577 [Rhizophagus irregularis]|uniref:RRM domain-containing protein n=1 Tax=Rhizophagus irregularis TaxID=588596 RepID=A0A2I1HHA8_9GLOM|nr:hypothetical protein RhiirA4_429577 [Rhizophagus irregularis]